MAGITMDSAYCLTKNLEMTIDEAREDFLRYRQELKFVCSDPNCRDLEKQNPKVSAVNYKAEIFIRQPHFKHLKDHPHAPGCFWGEFYKVEKEMRRNRTKYAPTGRNIFQKGENVDSADVVDIFVPWNERQAPKGRTGVTGRNRMLWPASRKEQEYLVANSPKQTTLFERLTGLYQAMSDQDRKIFRVTISGCRRSFADTFKPVVSITPNDVEPFVFYGQARVYNKKDTGFYLFFAKLHEYDGYYSIPLTVLVEHARYEENPALYKSLSSAAGTTHKTCQVFIFSHDSHGVCCTDAADRKRICYSEEHCVTFRMPTMREISVHPVAPVQT